MHSIHLICLPVHLRHLHGKERVVDVLVGPVGEVHALVGARVLQEALAVEVAEDGDVVGAVVAQRVEALLARHLDGLQAAAGLHGHAIVLAEEVELEGVLVQQARGLEDVGHLEHPRRDLGARDVEGLHEEWQVEAHAVERAQARRVVEQVHHALQQHVVLLLEDQEVRLALAVVHVRAHHRAPLRRQARKLKRVALPREEALGAHDRDRVLGRVEAHRLDVEGEHVMGGFGLVGCVGSVWFVFGAWRVYLRLSLS